MNRILLLLSAFLLSTVLYAQCDTLEFPVEIRCRSILDKGYKTFLPNDENPFLTVSQRSRFGVRFYDQSVESFISIQDVRFWGDDNLYSSTKSSGNTHGVSLFQAFVLLHPGQTTRLKIGRQIISRDDQRILSARGWNDYQQTYDALLFQFHPDKSLMIETACSWNSDGIRDNRYPAEKIRSLSFLRMAKVSGNKDVSCISMCTAMPVSDSSRTLNWMCTHGLNAEYMVKRLSISISTYYQHDVGNTSRQISAYCFSGRLKYDYADLMEIKTGIDVLSGNNKSNSRIQRRFNSLYGRRHAYYGAMDYFNKTPDEGLLDIYVIAETKCKAYTVTMGYHHLSLAHKHRNIGTGGPMHPMLGHEIDLCLKYSFSKDIILRTGYSIMFCTETLKALKGAPSQSRDKPYFLFLMIEYHPAMKLCCNKKL